MDNTAACGPIAHDCSADIPASLSLEGQGDSQGKCDRRADDSGRAEVVCGDIRHVH